MYLYVIFVHVNPSLEINSNVRDARASGLCVGNVAAARCSVKTESHRYRLTQNVFVDIIVVSARIAKTKIARDPLRTTREMIFIQKLGACALFDLVTLFLEQRSVIIKQ